MNTARNNLFTIWPRIFLTKTILWGGLKASSCLAKALGGLGLSCLKSGRLCVMSVGGELGKNSEITVFREIIIRI